VPRKRIFKKDDLRRLRILMSRREISPEELFGATAVVLDVLAATTTLLTIIENGARHVFPARSLEEAEEIAGKLDAAQLIRGGEQGGKNIPGYDLGPLPQEYPPEAVVDRDVIFVTTNGTRAIAGAASAEKVLVGCLRNAPAIARYLEDSGTESAYLICAGSKGRFNHEDFLGAAIILSYMNPEDWRLDDAATMALDFAHHHEGNIRQALESGRVGRWFVENGHARTLDFFAAVGASKLVPEVVDGRLVRAGQPANKSARAGEEPTR